MTEDAERELNTVLTLQMLSKKIGDELDCVVTGLMNFGLFVQSRKLGVEGLIQMSDLGPDRWKYDRKTKLIVGQDSGHVIRLGQFIRVRITSVNVPARQLNVIPVEPLVKSGREKSAASRTRRRRPRRRWK